MAEVVGWDLDSSLCRTAHRRHLIPEIRAKRATWDDYSMLCLEDEPIEGAVALMRLMTEMDPYVQHVAISGRSARALPLTSQWAFRHGVPLSRFMLRPDGDHTPNGKWKVKCLRQLEDEGLTVRLFVEDWDQAAKYIREETGIPVLGLNPFDEGSALVTRDALAAALDAHPAYANADWVEPEVLAADIFSRLGGGW
jgi:hypothetical protein